MSEEQKQALKELALICAKYGLTINSLEGKVHFIFAGKDRNTYLYAHVFDRYTTIVQKWADVEIGSDE